MSGPWNPARSPPFFSQWRGQAGPLVAPCAEEEAEAGGRRRAADGGPRAPSLTACVTQARRTEATEVSGGESGLESSAGSEVFRAPPTENLVYDSKRHLEAAALVPHCLHHKYVSGACQLTGASGYFCPGCGLRAGTAAPSSTWHLGPSVLRCLAFYLSP